MVEDRPFAPWHCRVEALLLVGQQVVALGLHLEVPLEQWLELERGFMQLPGLFLVQNQIPRQLQPHHLELQPLVRGEVWR